MKGRYFEPDQRAFPLLYVAWLIALIATLGALYIGEILGQTPCQLCWYQRIAMFPLALILGMACLTGDTRVVRYAMPLAGVGAALAIWHVLLFYAVIPQAIEPCGQGPSCRSADMTVLGNVPIPVLSFVAFASIVAILLRIAGRGARE